jgi:hypothetical protein
MPDYLIYNNDTISTYNLILEQYLSNQDTSEVDRLFGLSFRDGASFNCWRGYQAIYKIDNDSLFLVDIIYCGELHNGQINKKDSAERLQVLFGKRIVNGRVFIDWFSGYINFPLTNNVIRWDGVFYKIFEKEEVLTINGGEVDNIESVVNYIDDPDRIDRRDKSKVSDILFKQLKKSKWRNDFDYDCSERYYVTIDENGNVSNVRMLQTKEDIERFYSEDEYDYCMYKMHSALKSLKFDIIKDKGIPISEDIYIEIWIEGKGKLENWTN